MLPCAIHLHLQAACYKGPQGAKTRELYDVIMEKGFMPSWAGSSAGDKISNINATLRSSKVAAVLVHIGDYKYALRCFGVQAVPRPEKKAGGAGATQAAPATQAPAE